MTIDERHSLAVMLSFIVLAISVQLLLPHNPKPSPVGILRDSMHKSPLKPRIRINLAVAYAEAHQYDQAIREYQAAVWLADKRTEHERYMAASEAAIGMGKIFIDHGQLKEAEEVLVSTWNQYPGDPGLAVNLSQLLMIEKKPTSAIIVLNNGITTWTAERTHEFPFPGYLYFNRGAAYQMLGNCEQATADYQRAASMDADLAKAPVCP